MADFSPELIEVIFEQIASRSDIKACSTVCRSWRDATRSRVLSAVILAPSKYNENDGDKKLYDEDEVKVMIDSFLEIPGIARLVTRFELDFQYSDSLVTSSKPFHHLLTFPHIKELSVARLSRRAPATELKELIKHNPTITTLSFKHLYFSDPWDAYMMAEALDEMYLPHLTRFNLSSWKLFDGSEPHDFHVLVRGSGIAKDVLEVADLPSDPKVDDLVDFDNEPNGVLPAVFKLMDLSEVNSLSLRRVDFRAIQPAFDTSSKLTNNLSLSSILHFSSDRVEDSQFSTIIADNLPNLKTLELRFNGPFGSHYYIPKPSRFRPLQSLQSLQNLGLELVFRHEEERLHRSLLEELDQLVHGFVLEMTRLRSVTVSVPACNWGELAPDECFSLTREAFPGILHLGLS